MEETRDDAYLLDELHLGASWGPLEFSEKLQLTSQISSERASNSKVSSGELELDGGEASQRASQTLWATGKLAEQIPDGFYFFNPERRFKEFYDTVPTLDELQYLDSEGLRPNVILVDTYKDKKLLMLKQLAYTLVKGLSSNPVAVIKKIAGLVFDFYKCPNLEANPIKSGLEEVSHTVENHGILLLCQIKQGSCQSKAILFKVLADTVGINSKLIVGLPREGVMERTDSHKHISVTVVLDSVELLVDLVRFPGRLAPCTSETIFLYHISESESTGNSYNSPIEPSSPTCGFSGQVEIEGNEYEESLPYPYHSKQASSTNVSGASTRSSMAQSKTLVKHELTLSRSEPNVANSFWWLSQKNVIADQSTSGLSPERPSFRGHGRSILGGCKHSFREFRDDLTTSRSAGTSPVDPRRRRRRCISMIPEIGDDIVRVVRAMNETLKRNRPPGEQFYTSNSCSANEKDENSDLEGSVSKFHLDHHDMKYGRRVTTYNFHERNMNSQKAISLPSSPRYFTRQSSGRGETVENFRSIHIISTVNKELEIPKILNEQLLPFQEWNIDFSEIKVGMRIGIGFFGEVFRGIWNGIDVAIKVFLEQDLTLENIEDFCNEISILSRLRHPNVILFLGACTNPPRLSMVTEYMEMGSLYHLIHVSEQRKRLSLRRRIKMLCDICRGLMCMHRMKIAHRDLKSANCLVNRHWTVKICDFGLSRVLTTTPMRDSSSAGTPEWMAPELIRNEPFTEKCDIFSLGVIIWELCTLNRPWDGVPSVQVIYAVANDGQRLEVPQGPLGQLISDCWAQPDERPSCREILSRLLYCESTLC